MSILVEIKLQGHKGDKSFKIFLVKFANFESLRFGYDPIFSTTWLWQMF